MTINYLPKVTIVIPMKNEETYIYRCINAVLYQTYPHNKVDIIVVDNGSTDNSSNIVEKIMHETKRVKLVKKNYGTIASIRNYGAEYAHGEIIAFLDGDCVPSPDWINTGVEILLSDQEIGCVGFTEPERDQDAPWVERAWQYVCSSNIDKEFANVSWLSSFNLMMRLSVFHEVNGFTEELATCEDANLGYKIGRQYRLIMSNKAKVHHLGDPKSLLEFFKKELWRGQSSLKNFYSGQNKSHDFLSVFVPIVYVFLLFVFIFFLCIEFFIIKTHHNSTNYIGLFLLISPIILALKKNKKKITLLVLSQTSLLFFIYLIARGLGFCRNKG